MNQDLLAQAAELKSKIEGCEHAMEQVVMPTNVHRLRITLYTGVQGEKEKINVEHYPTITRIRSLLIDVIGNRLDALKQEAEELGEWPAQIKAPAKYTPKPGDIVTTPDYLIPLTVETFDPMTMTCGLAGFAPGEPQLKRVGPVCAMSLTPHYIS